MPGAGSSAQLTDAERAEYDKWEDFLKTAKVVDQEQAVGRPGRDRALDPDPREGRRPVQGPLEGRPGRAGRRLSRRRGRERSPPTGSAGT
ncbi:MAG: hypothetical protein M0C28_02770 [Candidatus Moduliflexus flocculans]|nr:hypothetical protein [Candidatus Moduliflexus flocculans]